MGSGIMCEVVNTRNMGITLVYSMTEFQKFGNGSVPKRDDL